MLTTPQKKTLQNGYKKLLTEENGRISKDQRIDSQDKEVVSLEIVRALESCVSDLVTKNSRKSK